MTINIYWAPNYNGGGDSKYKETDWTFLYPKPRTLFSMLMDDRVDVKINDSTFFSCPAVAKKFKKIYVFRSPMDMSYFYDFDNGFINNTSESHIAAHYNRMPNMNSTSTINLALQYMFFADKPVDAYFTPPFFSKPKYLNYGSFIPGEFDIGQWFRPYVAEIETWSKVGELRFEIDEPLFYVEFKTDEDIKLHRFEMNEKLFTYSISCVASTDIFGRGQSMLSRYKRFKDVGFREKVLTEINKNLIIE